MNIFLLYRKCQATRTETGARNAKCGVITAGHPKRAGSTIASTALISGKYATAIIPTQKKSMKNSSKKSPKINVTYIFYESGHQ